MESELIDQQNRSCSSSTSSRSNSSNKKHKSNGFTPVENKRIHVAIVGGGIGGFGLAVALQQRGIRFTVYEKDNSFDERRQGYGLTMQQGQSCLRELGLADELIKRDTPSSSHYIFDAKGNVVGFFGPKFRTTGRHAHIKVEKPDSNASSSSSTKKRKAQRGQPRFNIHTPRQQLRRLLCDQIEPQNIQWGFKLTNINFDEKSLRLQFSNGVEHTADLIVGADGIYSVVRQKIFAHNQFKSFINENVKVKNNDIDATNNTDNINNNNNNVNNVNENNDEKNLDDNCMTGSDDLQYLDVLVVLGIVETDHELFLRRVLQMVDGTTRIFIMPFTEKGEYSDANRTMWQLSFPVPAADAHRIAASSSTLKAEVLRRCGEWCKPVADMLRASREELICGTPVYDRSAPTLATRARRAVLIGDAAHPMSPFKGQGANQALLDAISLAQALHSAKHTLDTALDAYQLEMTRRAVSKVRGSRAMVQRLHSDTVLSTDAVAAARGIHPQHVQLVRAAGIGAWTHSIDERIVDVLVDAFGEQDDDVDSPHQSNQTPIENSNQTPIENKAINN